MLTKNKGGIKPQINKEKESVPSLSIKKIGVVSRDYNHRYKNGYRDFSDSLPDLLKMLDGKGCDTVLFSLFSLIPRNSFSPNRYFKNLDNIKAIFLEEFEDEGNGRSGKRFVVYYREHHRWREYQFFQKFGNLREMNNKAMRCFVKNEMPKRMMGSVCAILCGESNGVKYSPKDKKIQDIFDFRKSIDDSVKIILNPIHDRMTRFEMKLKRKFLSENGRWVISVWNKGKKDKNGKVKAERNPPWTIYHNGEEVSVPTVENELGIEIGILNINSRPDYPR